MAKVGGEIELVGEGGACRLNETFADLDARDFGDYPGMVYTESYSFADQGACNNLCYAMDWCSSFAYSSENSKCILYDWIPTAISNLKSDWTTRLIQLEIISIYQKFFFFHGAAAYNCTRKLDARTMAPKRGRRSHRRASAVTESVLRDGDLLVLILTHMDSVSELAQAEAVCSLWHQVGHSNAHLSFLLPHCYRSLREDS